MCKIFNKPKRDPKHGPKRDPIGGHVNIAEAMRIIQEIIQDPLVVGEIKAKEHHDILEDAMAGSPDARTRTQQIISELLEEHEIEVEGMERKDVSYEIYKHAWGLGPLEEIYFDPEVNEIRVNSYNRIHVVKNIKSGSLDISLPDDGTIRNIITRMIMSDQGVAINKSRPTAESMRKDATRVTATCYPVTKNTTFVLRKHPHKLITPGDMIKRNSMNERICGYLRCLVKGRANILVSGGVGSGKTTLLRAAVSWMDPKTRIVVLGTDSELLLSVYYPEMDIIEFEEHSESGMNLDALFRIALRYSPNTIIVEEFRGAGEASEAINACIRGHNGLATAHFTSTRKAVEGTAKLLVKEGAYIDLKNAVSDVASAFDIIVQMYGDTVRGVIMLESMTEVIYDQGNIEYRDLVRWVPKAKNYLEGDWVFEHTVSPILRDSLCKVISIDELKEVGLA